MRKPNRDNALPAGDRTGRKANNKKERAAQFLIRGATIKRAIVRLAVLGFVPATVASWLLSFLHLREV